MLVKSAGDVGFKVRALGWRAPDELWGAVSVLRTPHPAKAVLGSLRRGANLSTKVPPPFPPLSPPSPRPSRGQKHLCCDYTCARTDSCYLTASTQFCQAVRHGNHVHRPCPQPALAIRMV